MERQEVKAMVDQVYSALEVKGYRPIDQMKGYILTEDPHNRGVIRNRKTELRNDLKLLIIGTGGAGRRGAPWQTTA